MGGVAEFAESAEFAEFRLADDTAVRVELATVGQPPPPGEQPDDLPEGFEAPVPAGRGARAAAELAAGSLRFVLRPLGPLLQEVHDSLSGVSDPPDEICVEFGVQIGQDLKLGIVGANGQASLKVAATWRLAAAPAPVTASLPGPVAAALPTVPAPPNVLPAQAFPGAAPTGPALGAGPAARDDGSRSR